MEDMNKFDETPRPEVRRELLCEVNQALASRREVGADEPIRVLIADDPPYPLDTGEGTYRSTRNDLP